MRGADEAPAYCFCALQNPPRSCRRLCGVVESVAESANEHDEPVGGYSPVSEPPFLKDVRHLVQRTRWWELDHFSLLWLLSMAVDRQPGAFASVVLDMIANEAVQFGPRKKFGGVT